MQIPGAFRPIIAALVLLNPAYGFGQTAPHTQVSPAHTAVKSTDDLPARLAALEKALDAARKNLHVPGASLVIVRNGKVVFLKGSGLRDIEHKQPVGPDTVFAIGSSSKAFTAMTAMMSVDDGKLALTDSPKKYLPYFKLRDPDADAQITIGDLMSHRSGLPRTDMAWYSGKLSSEEVIRLAGEAKPTARLGEKFQYQNVMFLAAGQIVGQVQHAPWTTVVTDRIFKPLEMHATSVSINTMQRSPDFAVGYRFDEAQNRLIPMPMRDLEVIAPAGAINSTARDMAHWLEFMLDNGVYHGKRLVSERSFAELTTKRINVGGNIDYGYGWMLEGWKGHRVVEHGGNIDGFSAEVALMPDQHLGFVLLTNANATPLASQVKDLVWTGLLDPLKTDQAPVKATPGAAPEKEAGVYRIEAANLDVTVAYKDGALTLTVPGQPTYTLEPSGGRRYKLQALPGFFATFRATKGNPEETELLMEQPQGNFVAGRVKPGAIAAEKAATANYNGPMKDLIGGYANTAPRLDFEIVVKDGKVALKGPGAPALPLVEQSKDHFALQGLPETYGLIVKRDADGKVSGLQIKQPQGVLELVRETPFVASITTEELMRKVIEAEGGESALRKHRSRKETFTIVMENQGLKGEGTTYAQAPNSLATVMTLSAFGKQLFTTRDYFDGDQGGSENSLGPATRTAKTEIAARRVTSDFDAELNWKTLYKTVVIKRMSKVDEEEAYVVEYVPTSGQPTTQYISKKSYLPLKRESVATSSVGPLPVTATFRDYRDVDGIKISFLQTLENSITGKNILEIQKVEFDVPIPSNTFTPHQ